MKTVDDLIGKLEQEYSDKLIVNTDLSRSLVSFQANKNIPGYRWYKFKEGYSLGLVNYILSKLKISSRAKLFDPFAGCGTSLFGASQKGISSTGIELLPIGVEIINARRILFSGKNDAIRSLIKKWIDDKPWREIREPEIINYINITKGAYPPKTEVQMGKYLKAIRNIDNQDVKEVLKFALLCVIEDISYTRKDGQYLRWDHRAGKSNTKFSKGQIKDFDKAVVSKLQEIYEDTGTRNTLLSNEDEYSLKSKISLHEGSVLELLDEIPKDEYEIIMTSPPYCNRYDYTRTYALELVLLGAGEEEVKNMRQMMLSCTVENREKENLHELFGSDLSEKVNKIFDNHTTLQEILKCLTMKKDNGDLNNSGIVRMIKNYFYELALVIFRTVSTLKSGGYFVMVNDNVRYAGINIPVDLILSDFANSAGFDIDRIWVLPRGKGNSSQQMGKYGREELRKCVYIWKKL